MKRFSWRGRNEPCWGDAKTTQKSDSILHRFPASKLGMSKRFPLTSFITFVQPCYGCQNNRHVQGITSRVDFEGTGARSLYTHDSLQRSLQCTFRPVSGAVQCSAAAAGADYGSLHNS